MHPSRATLIVLALPLVATVAVSCGSSGTTANPATTVRSFGSGTSTTVPLAGHDPTTSVPAPAPGQVAIVDYDFTPNTITINAGETVTWVNADGADHWVVSAPTSPASFDLGRQRPGADVSHTFKTPGSYPYFCNLHNYMKGLVVVR